jgi:hypothetical protein
MPDPEPTQRVCVESEIGLYRPLTGAPRMASGAELGRKAVLRGVCSAPAWWSYHVGRPPTSRGSTDQDRLLRKAYKCRPAQSMNAAAGALGWLPGRNGKLSRPSALADSVANLQRDFSSKLKCPSSPATGEPKRLWRKPISNLHALRPPQAVPDSASRPTYIVSIT